MKNLLQSQSSPPPGAPTPPLDLKLEWSAVGLKHDLITTPFHLSIAKSGPCSRSSYGPTGISVPRTGTGNPFKITCSGPCAGLARGSWGCKPAALHTHDESIWGPWTLDWHIRLLHMEAAMGPYSAVQLAINKNNLSMTTNKPCPASAISELQA